MCLAKQNSTPNIDEADAVRIQIRTYKDNMP